METNRFAELAAIDVSKYVEKKQNLSYLSWAWAVDQLLRRDPAANWTYHDPVRFGDTMMVSCTVTAFGLPRTCHLPVMDNRNKAIANPDAFAVNTAMQRCLVKAIALHGLGLYIYAGEDVPRGETEEPKKPSDMGGMSAREVAQEAYDAMPEDARKVLDEWAADVTAMVDEGRTAEANAFLQKHCETVEDKLAIWSLLGSKTRSALKKAAQPALATQA